MNSAAIAIIVLLLAAFAIVFYLLLRKGRQEVPAAAPAADNAPFLLLQQQLQDLARLVDQKITATNTAMQTTHQELNKTMREQFGSSIKIVTDVTERLTKLDETNRQVVGFAAQLQSLQQTLQNPKQRGILGEYYLENVLKNVLPPNGYQMQYGFSDGEIVDAAIFVKDKIIPVDSKFSLENYNRAINETDETRRSELETIFKQDLKKRIDETSKYIKPKEGTMDFAFMFIPSEGIYYDLLINKVGTLKTNTQDLIDYAFKEKHVIIVSPTSFLAYLQTVMQGLRALQIEESAKEIRTRVEELGKHIVAYETYMSKLGNNLGTTVNSFNAAYKELNKIDKDVVKITDGERSLEPMQLEKPVLELE
jgi:DNA recombination protein RmuC